MYHGQIRKTALVLQQNAVSIPPRFLDSTYVVIVDTGGHPSKSAAHFKNHWRQGTTDCTASMPVVTWTRTGGQLKRPGSQLWGTTTQLYQLDGYHYVPLRRKRDGSRHLEGFASRMIDDDGTRGLEERKTQERTKWGDGMCSDGCSRDGTKPCHLHADVEHKMGIDRVVIEVWGVTASL